MNRNKWLVLGVTLGMMAATALSLHKLHSRVRLGPPGVKVGPGLLYDEEKKQVAQQCVLLPDSVLGLKGIAYPVTRGEVDALPKDTTFGRKEYLGQNNFNVETSVVLMGTDRTSIHQPQFCLEAAAWHIQQTEPIRLSMGRPYPYEIPALKLTTSKMFLDEHKHPVEIHGLYVYWFVTNDKITSDQGSRMWSLAKTVLEKGELERWAYIAYFATCAPGQEEATFQQLKKFIQASAPEFQTVAGPSATGSHIAIR